MTLRLAAVGSIILAPREGFNGYLRSKHKCGRCFQSSGRGNSAANSGAGKIYGDSILTATSSALTLQGDQIGDDASATNAFGVSSTSLNINAGDNGNGLVKVTGAAIRLDTLNTKGSGAVAITTTGGDPVVGDGANNAISNTGTVR